MSINWTVRLKNKAFWLALIPSLLLLVQQLAAVCGFTLDLTALQEQLMGLAGTVFTLLALFGVVNDPTTAGASDSARALGYTQPQKGE
ncbi:phage holin [Ruthenibacterium sp. CLA-JM-H11]|uniref:Phage holin n=1 Tax=Ruthenibacterium intestinale TaxID=3133163 RepID=A0ABV1GFR8_9FIRM